MSQPTQELHAEPPSRTPDAHRSEDGPAERTSALGSDLIAYVAHELRTPLTTILTWTHMLRARVTDPWERKAIEVLDRNARLEARLVDELLDVARIAEKRLRLEEGACDLSLVASQTVQAARPQAEARQVELTLEPAPATFVVETMDGPRITQVIAQLLHNAIKATEPGGQVSLRFEASSVDRSVRFVVHDTGCGLTPEQLSSVFEGWRGRTQGARGERGLGLGLFIARHLVELHGGEITATSPGVGRGATFTVALPLPAPI